MKMLRIKIKAIYAQKIWLKEKTFELRKNDRDYQVGDRVMFDVIDDANWHKLFANRLYEITYVLKDVPEYGLDKEYCIFSIQPIFHNI